MSRRLHGRRGLKCFPAPLSAYVLRRRLHGRRGLKYNTIPTTHTINKSPPSRAAWIEIKTL